MEISSTNSVSTASAAFTAKSNTPAEGRVLTHPDIVPLLGQQIAAATSAAATTADAHNAIAGTNEQLQNAIDNANSGLKNLQNQSSALEFTVDHDLGRIIVRLVDTRTKEVIRQYPPEEVLEIARQMDKLVGKLLKEKA